MDYIVYAKYNGCKTFAAFDLENGCKAEKIIFASTYSKNQFEHAKSCLQHLVDENKQICLQMQLRENNGNIAWQSK